VVWLLTALLECLDQIKCNGPCHKLCWLSAYTRSCPFLIWSNVTIISITAIMLSTIWNCCQVMISDHVMILTWLSSNWCSEVLVVSDCVTPLMLLHEWTHLMCIHAVRCYQRSWLPDCAMSLMSLSISTARSAMVAPHVTDWMIVQCNWHSCHC